MAYQALEDDRLDRLDRLDLGTGKLRGAHPSWWPALGLVLGVVAGWGAHAATDLASGADVQSSGRSLVVGAFQPNLFDPYGPEFLVSVANTGRTAVTIANVAPEGWHARTDPVQVLPRTTVDIPVDVSLDCATARSWPGDRAEVRIGTGTSARTTLLPIGGSPALYQLWSRRCMVGTLRTPTRRDLVGTWVVSDGGPAFTGRMFVKLASDGRYTMDPGPHFGDSAGAAGVWSLQDERVTLVPTRGGDCGPRHRAVWEVGMRGSLLRIRQLTTYDGYCTVEPGDVWISQRVR